MEEKDTEHGAFYHSSTTLPLILCVRRVHSVCMWCICTKLAQVRISRDFHRIGSQVLAKTCARARVCV